SLQVRFRLLALLRNRVIIQNINWNDLQINIYTGKDEKPNYQFLVDRFAGEPKASGRSERAKQPGSSRQLQFSIGPLVLKNCKIRYRDRPGGIDAAIGLGKLEIRPGAIIPSTGVYDFSEIIIENLGGYYGAQYRAPKNPADLVDTAAGSIKIS